MDAVRMNKWLGAAAIAALAAWQILPAIAQPAPTPGAPAVVPIPAPAGTPAPGTPAAPPVPSGQTPPALPPPAITADVSGFRSARFGMTQEQVREAIKSDFGIEAKDVKAGNNDQEKTKYIAVQVSNLVPDSGMALVTYLFGYTSQRLIQVNVVWGKLAGQEAKPAELVTTGRLLQQYFVGQGFARDTMIVNRTTNTGAVVLFNGFDEKKRSVLLVLDTMAVPLHPDAPPPAPAPAPPPGAKAPAGKPDPKAPAKPADGKPTDKKQPEMQLVAASLRLSYIENAVNPDVFRIQRGKF